MLSVSPQTAFLFLLGKHLYQAFSAPLIIRLERGIIRYLSFSYREKQV